MVSNIYQTALAFFNIELIIARPKCGKVLLILLFLGFINNTFLDLCNSNSTYQGNLIFLLPESNGDEINVEPTYYELLGNER